MSKPITEKDGKHRIPQTQSGNRGSKDSEGEGQSSLTFYLFMAR